MRLNKFGALLLASALAFATIPASAQVFDPLSKSQGGVMTGNIVYAGPAPTVTGTGSPTILGDDTAGVATAGASATSVVITFGGGGYSAVPYCVVGSQTQLAAFAYVVTATAITITQTATSGNKINYHCDPSS